MRQNAFAAGLIPARGAPRALSGSWKGNGESEMERAKDGKGMDGARGMKGRENGVEFRGVGV